MIRIPQWNIIIVHSFAPLNAKATAYENEVRALVYRIGRSNTGKALYKTFFSPTNPDTAVWIMPYNGPAGVCQSQTGAFYGQSTKPGQAQSYEGARIQYSPERFALDACGWYPGLRADETLIHEMVHASRELNNPAYDNTPLYRMSDYEEFLAVLATNMYRSENHATTFHREYVLKELVSQQEAEDFLSSKRQFIDALAFLLDDPLVKLLTGVDTTYNPFRDFGRIKANYSSLRELKDDLNPLKPILENLRLEKKGKKLSEMHDISVSGSAKATNHK